MATKIWVNIGSGTGTYLKIHSNLPGANELMWKYVIEFWLKLQDGD